jgi:eukaryotic-like serine/threonine-protein kinase
MKFVKLLFFLMLCSSGLFAQVKVITYEADFAVAPVTDWVFKTDKPIFSSPIIENNTVYFGGRDQYVYALDLGTGTVRWKFKTNGEIRSTVVISKNKLFVVSGDGFVYVLDKSTGKNLWKFKTEGERTYELFSYADYYQSTPVLDDGSIYFGSGDGQVYALDVKTGNLKWKYKTGSVVHASPAIQDGQLFIGSFDGFFYALNKTDGKLLWKFKSVGQSYFPKGEMQGNPVVFDNRVFVGSRDYNFYSTDIKQGFCYWNKQFPKGWAMGTPAIRDSVLYVGTSDDMVLLALDPFTGATKWKADVKFNVFGGPAFTESMVYAGSLMGKLFGIDLKTGAIKWTITTNLYNKNKTKYFKNDLYRDDIQSIIQKGEDFLTMYYELGAFFSTPAISEGRLIITSTDGSVYCFKR